MVSILVPVYNAAPYLHECVQSLTGQTYKDLQIVLINDGSTDDSWTIMQQLAKADNRIEVYSQSNHGVAATRNRLLEKVRGDFVLFVDSDDWIELNTIELLLQKQAKEDYDMVLLQLSYLFVHPESYNQEQAVSKFLEHTIFRGSLCDKLVKSEIYEGLATDENVCYGEDAILVWQMLQRVKRVGSVNRLLYHYRLNDNGLTRQKFDGKRFTAYTAWEMICRETDIQWPQFRDVAHARFACEMTQVLRSAAESGYHKDAAIRLLQEEVRRDCSLITKTGISSRKMSLYAWLVSHSYEMACLLSKFMK